MSAPSAVDSQRKERHTWLVAVYNAELGYGGPEEGGWWFDTGELVRIVRASASEDRAYAYCRKLNNRLRSREFGPNKGRRDKSSVLSDGFFEARVYRDNAPKSFPDHRPHYEEPQFAAFSNSSGALVQVRRWNYE